MAILCNLKIFIKILVYTLSVLHFFCNFEVSEINETKKMYIYSGFIWPSLSVSHAAVPCVCFFLWATVYYVCFDYFFPLIPFRLHFLLIFVLLRIPLNCTSLLFFCFPGIYLNYLNFLNDGTHHVLVSLFFRFCIKILEMVWMGLKYQQWIVTIETPSLRATFSPYSLTSILPQ